MRNANHAVTRKGNRKRPALRNKRRRNPTLRFTPYAWAKLQFLRDLGDTEVGGFGIAPSEDQLLIEDVCLVCQICTFVTVEFDDEAVADFFDEQVDRGLRPEQFARVWIHTHPGDSAAPSLLDETTFGRCFGRSDWSVMFILANSGDTYACLRFGDGRRCPIELQVETDFAHIFPAADHLAWQAEYQQCVTVTDPLPLGIVDVGKKNFDSVPTDPPQNSECSEELNTVPTKQIDNRGIV